MAKAKWCCSSRAPGATATTHLVMSPLELLQLLAALVPRPQLHLIRFHGGLAPHAKLRAAIVPIPAAPTHAYSTDCHHAPSSPARMSWARLLKRVFDIDIEPCPDCGGELKIIAAIEAPGVIVRILSPLRLPALAPPREPRRLPKLIEAAQTESPTTVLESRPALRLGSRLRKKAKTAGRLAAWD